MSWAVELSYRGCVLAWYLWIRPVNLIFMELIQRRELIGKLEFMQSNNNVIYDY